MKRPPPTRKLKRMKRKDKLSLRQQKRLGEKYDISPPIPHRPKVTDVDQQRGYMLWTCDSAEPFLGNYGPDESRINQPFMATGIPGEYCCIVIGIWGVNHIQTVRVESGQSPFEIKIHRADYDRQSIPWPNSNKKQTFDIPFGLPQENIGEIQANANTVFWVTFYIPLGSLPGQTIGVIRLKFPGCELPEHHIAYAIDVLPFRLKPADIAFGMFYNLGRFPAERRYPHYELSCFEDMAEHGHTSAFIGLADGDPEYDVLADQIHARWQAGLLHARVPFLLVGALGGDNPDVPAITHALGIKQLENDWPEPLIYGPDEPGEHTDLTRTDIARAAMRTATSMKLHAWPKYGKHFDVWILCGGGVTQETVEKAQASGSEVWTYICNRRGTNAAFNRFYSGVYTWALRLKGNFCWAYCDYEQGFSWILPEDDGPVPTIGWESRREGILDYRLLRACEIQALDSDTPLAGEALMWLRELRDRAKWQAASMKYIDNEQLAMDRANPCKKIAPYEYAEIRAQAAGYLIGMFGNEKAKDAQAD